ncbi:MAG: NUDIX domain-containing protein [Bacteroidales bacterium]|nr:NUDIX domain-containing protein [Bacteroidales bacterium]HOY38809.1 NUDIX domain-containing protein [Bacteroidales bacterium]HQP04957.1 NUDIX domain-containing protein [Bacteroidales bacterium]
MIEIQKIALVNENDEITGYGEKFDVHRRGLLHRAFSVQIIHPEKGFLLQKRALRKYHSAGLWSNTCCSHLPENFEMETAVRQRLMLEMGIDCKPVYVGKFAYSSVFRNGFTENEIDHVYVGIWEGVPEMHPDEADSFTWIFPDMLKINLAAYPELYTVWLPFVFDTIRNSENAVLF